MIGNQLKRRKKPGGDTGAFTMVSSRKKGVLIGAYVCRFSGRVSTPRYPRRLMQSRTAPHWASVDGYTAFPLTQYLLRTVFFSIHSPVSYADQFLKRRCSFRAAIKWFYQVCCAVFGFEFLVHLMRHIDDGLTLSFRVFDRSICTTAFVLDAFLQFYLDFYKAAI